jgi:hypothetical protein
MPFLSKHVLHTQITLLNVTTTESLAQRARAERAELQVEQYRDATMQVLAAKDAEIARLTDTIVAMKRQGFASDPEVRQRDESPDLPEMVMEAIVGRAGTTGSSLGVQLMAEAQRMLRDKMDPEVVASAIWTGEGEDA